LKVVGKASILLLVVLLSLAFSVSQTYAYEGELEVYIDQYVVEDIDGDGVKDDLQLTGIAELKLEEPPEDDEVTMVVSLHLEHESGSSIIATQTLLVELDDGEATVKFVFTVYDLEAGDYLAYLTAQCGGLSAESETEIIDPEGGTVGPI
jgi:hypothetical protein